jgi:hypothetical protein
MRDGRHRFLQESCNRAVQILVFCEALEARFKHTTAAVRNQPYEKTYKYIRYSVHVRSALRTTTKSRRVGSSTWCTTPSAWSSGTQELPPHPIRTPRASSARMREKWQDLRIVEESRQIEALNAEDPKLDLERLREYGRWWRTLCRYALARVQVDKSTWKSGDMKGLSREDGGEGEDMEGMFAKRLECWYCSKSR